MNTNRLNRNRPRTQAHLCADWIEVPNGRKYWKSILRPLVPGICLLVCSLINFIYHLGCNVYECDLIMHILCFFSYATKHLFSAAIDHKTWKNRSLMVYAPRFSRIIKSFIVLFLPAANESIYFEICRFFYFQMDFLMCMNSLNLHRVCLQAYKNLPSDFEWPINLSIVSIQEII